MLAKLFSAGIIFLRDSISVIIFLGIVAKRLFVKLPQVRILVYHEIKKRRYRKLEDPLRLIVPGKLFSQHMEFLKKNNWQVITFSQMLDMFGAMQPLNPKTIVLSFDDGFEGVYSYALPVLMQYSYPATIFLTVDFIDKKIKSSHFCGYPYTLQPLSWSQVREMSSKDFSFGSHSLTHPRLINLEDKGEELTRELLYSKKRIQQVINRDINYFAIPYGDERTFNEEVVEAIKAAGYRANAINHYGINQPSTNRFRLKRTRIYSNDNLFRFTLKLLGAYDWVDSVRSFGQ